VANRDKSQFITPGHIWEARTRISPFMNKTPLIKSKTLSEITKKNIYLKLETMNEVGSFKLRGAANKILSLSKEEQQVGVTTFSTGNHGLAVAYMARRLGIPVVVCVSKRVPSAKIKALKSVGAKLEIVGDSQDEAQKHCEHLHQRHGMTIISPFDDLDVIAGQGTIGLELLEDLPEINHCLIPLSGGGLLAGIGMALKSTNESIKITGLSVEEASAMHASIQAGTPVEVGEKETLADSLLGGIGLNNKYTFKLVNEVMDELVLATESTIAKGMSHLFGVERQIAEGAAAVGVGAILDQKIEVLGDHTVLIISGNNVDRSVLDNISIKEIDTIKGACL
jgi:threonine dehydratase